MKEKSPALSIIRFTVNGSERALTVGGTPAQVSPTHTLAHTLRNVLGLTGTKVSCDKGACGACTVIINGEAVLSCMLLTVACGGAEITTVEGLADRTTGNLDPLQEEFASSTAFQCGYCTPGILMSARALLDENPHPTGGEVRDALAGNFCRCITHYHVVDAVLSAAKGDGHD